MPLLPGSHFFENMAAAWEKGNFDRVMLNSLIVAGGVTAGKIVLSALSAFSIVYFSYRLRMLMFWLIFITLMLPLEVRIVPTYAVAADVLRPFQSMIDVTGLVDRPAGMEPAQQLFRPDPAAGRHRDRHLPLPPVLPDRAGRADRGGEDGRRRAGPLLPRSADAAVAEPTWRHSPPSCSCGRGTSICGRC